MLRLIKEHCQNTQNPPLSLLQNGKYFLNAIEKNNKWDSRGKKEKEIQILRSAATQSCMAGKKRKKHIWKTLLSCQVIQKVQCNTKQIKDPTGFLSSPFVHIQHDSKKLHFPNIAFNSL